LFKEIAVDKINGIFKCPCEEYSSANPAYLNKHWNRSCTFRLTAFVQDDLIEESTPSSIENLPFPTPETQETDTASLHRPENAINTSNAEEIRSLTPETPLPTLRIINREPLTPVTPIRFVASGVQGNANDNTNILGADDDQNTQENLQIPPETALVIRRARLGTHPDLVTSEILEHHGLMVNRREHLLICIECQYALIPTDKSIVNHIYAVHRRKKRGNVDLGAEALEHDFLLSGPDDYIGVPQVTGPVAGLKIYEGFGCDICAYYTVEKTRYISHLTEFHPGVEMNVNSVRCFQTLTPAVKMRKYFKVTVERIPATLAEEPRGLFDLDACEALLQQTIAGPLDHKSVSSFFTISKWYKIIRLFRNGMLARLVEITDNQRQSLEILMEAMFYNGTEFSDEAHRANARIFDDEDFTKYGGGNFFRTLREPKSIKEYKLYAVQLVLCMLKVIILLPTHPVYSQFRNEASDILGSLDGNLNDELKLRIMEFLDKTVCTYFCCGFKKTMCPIYTALVVLCCRDDESFEPLLWISRKIAKTKYFLRMLTLFIIDKKTKESFPTVATINEDSDTDSDNEHSDIEALEPREHEENMLEMHNLMRTEEEYFEYFTTKRNSPIKMILDISKLIGAYGIDPPMPEVYWDEASNGQVVIADGEAVSLSNLKAGVRCAMEEIRSLITQMLHGFRPNLPSRICDSLQEVRPGYCFITDTRNGLEAERRRFIRHLNHEQIPLYNLLRHWKQFIKLLVFCIHSTCGYGSRGTELATCQWINTKTAPRNLFIYGDRVAIVFSHNKTNNIKNYDRSIPRFLPKVLSDILIQYLVYLQPSLRGAQSTMYESVNMQDEIKLFYEGSHCYNADKVRLVFSQEFFRHVGVKIPFHLYRHVVECFGTFHLPSIYNDDFYKKLCVQAGHSETIGEVWYGARNMQFRHVSRANMHIMLQLSNSWQELLLGTGAPLNSSLGPRQLALTAVDQPTPIQMDRRVHVNINVGNILAEQETLEGDFEGHSRGIAANHGELSMQLLTRLRELFRVNGFSCPEQGKAILEINLRRRDILVCLPTGMGKTATVLVNAKYERTTTVFIVPLVAIKNMLVRECRRLNISCQAWNPEMTEAECQVLIVGIEQLGREELVPFLQRTGRQGQLSRIVIDECHLVLQWQEFRRK
jgi:Orsellinic acid/F9775 biosynthesis cluster protein D/DEAD/DEAH box helicase